MSQLPVEARTGAAPSKAWSCQELADTRDNLTRKLRLSLVDSCNLKCFFCHNEGQGVVKRSSSSVMSVEEIAQIAAAAVRAGVREIKITGGEPLLYRARGYTIVDVVREINKLRSSEHFGLSMTTNGLLLPKYAEALAVAGLDRVTVSLHTLDDRKFSQLVSRSPGMRAERISAGIRAAVDAGLTPVKVNTVLFHSEAESMGNIDEIHSIVSLCRSMGVAQVRLYTLLRHQDFGAHADWYQRWSDDVLFAAGNAVLGDEGAAAIFINTAKEFLDSSRSVVYPRPHLILAHDNFELMIESLEAGQFDALGLPDEGPYALRVSADGQLRGLISGQESATNLVQLVRKGCGFDSLVGAFRDARQNAMPADPGRSTQT